MSDPPEQEPRLAPPGAGVPATQRWVGGHLLLPAYCLWLSWERACGLLHKQARGLLDLPRGHDEKLLTRRVLVPSQIGLEDSSRYYSYGMVLEHLTIVGDAVARIVGDLTHSRVPVGGVRTADLKAEGRLAIPDATQNYRAMLGRFSCAALADTGIRQSDLRFEHPWFGPLSAYQWLCFAPFHQAIHLRQARRILRHVRTRS